MSATDNSVVCMPACQGFLKKRKDKIRLRWVTYWFKLHNATLYFYNKKHGGTSDLRGQYYVIEVESVREGTWIKKKNYSFEIAMKNGKRKTLAAESADLRRQWMYQLFQAMDRCVYNTTELISNSETAPPDYESRIESSPCSTWSNSQSEAFQSDVLVSRRHSAEPESCLWSPSKHSAAVNCLSTATSLIHIDYDMSPAESSQFTEDDVWQKAGENKLENDYDVLPCWKPLQIEEAIYDTPPSNRRLSEREHETENIYDVPKYAVRRESVTECLCANELPEITGLLREMVTCLGGKSADWIKATAPGTICQP